MTRVLFLHGASAGPHGRKRQAPREWRIPARTEILHYGSDELVPFAASARLLEEAARLATPGDAAMIDSIRRQLVDAGYSTLHDRLVRIGRDHQCNEPHPQDAFNGEGLPGHSPAPVGSGRRLGGSP